MSHTTPNNSPLHKRFLQATKYWISPGYHPDVEDFSALWFGSNCALLNYTAETAGEFDEETQRCLSNLLALKPHQHTDAAKKWLRRANGKDPEVPNAEVDAHAPILANSVMAIANGIAAVYRWRESHWGNDPVALESAREHVKTCWRAYAAALPVDGPLELHKCNLYRNPTKLAGLMALLNEPTTATHWLMLQRLFAFLLQNAPDGEPTRTRSASEATEPISTEEASLARRVSIPTAVEHEVVTHLVGVNVRGETRRLTVSRVAKGPPGWYLDPTELGATCVAPEILEQLSLASRVATNERRIDKQLKLEDPIPPLRVAIHSNLLASLTGRSAGLSLLMSMHAAANDGFLREDTLASSDIRMRPDFDQSQPLRLSDIETIPVEPKTIRLKAETIRGVPHLKRFVLSHAQTALDAAGQELAWNTWTTDKVQESSRIEYVPIENGKAAWLQMSGGPQIEAVEKYLADIIHYADTVPPYFPPGTELPNVRVQVRVRTELFRPDNFLARQNEHDRLNGADPRRIYSHRLHDDEEQRGQQAQMEEIVLDWDSQIRPKLYRGLLLGDPGFGKSWLQKHEARALAEKAKNDLHKNGMLHSLTWPVLLPLSDLANALAERKQNQPRDLLSVLLEVLRARETEPVVLEQITSVWGGERCVLLLDAWDEVDLTQQPALRRCLEEWARSHPQGRVLITSRIVGRPEPFWPTTKGSDADREMELQPFGDPQTREFIERFFRSTPHIASALIAALVQAPQIRGLSQIPLLLSFLCRFAYDQISEGKSNSVNSPTLDLRAIRRNDLYRYVVTQFLKGVWHPDRPTLDDASLESLLELVSHAAYHLLKDGYQKFQLALFEDKLADAQRHSARGFSVTKSEFDQLRNTLIGKNGLVIPASVGTGVSYLFLHLTFQEFLAANYLKSRPWSDVEPVLGTLWDHPDWHEVWELLVQEQARDLRSIECMVATICRSDNHHPLDRYLYRFRITAIRWLIIGEIELAATTPIVANCIQWAVRRIAQLSKRKGGNVFDRTRMRFVKRSLVRNRHWYLLIILLTSVSRCFGRLPNSLERMLLRSLESEIEIVQRLAAVALAPYAGRDPIQGVLLKLVNHRDDFIRCNAATAIASYADQQHVEAALLPKVDDSSYLVRGAVTSILAQRIGQPQIQEVFLGLIEHAESDVRLAATKALVPFASDLRVQTALLTRLNDDGCWASKYAAEALAPYSGQAHLKAAILAALSENSLGRGTMAIVPLAPSTARRDFLSVLLSRLDDANWSVRQRAAQGLESLADQEHVQAALIRKLDDDISFVRGMAVVVLISHAQQESIRSALISHLDDPDERVRFKIVVALTPYVDEERVFYALQNRTADANWKVRFMSFCTLAPYVVRDSDVEEEFRETPYHNLLNLEQKYELFLMALVLVPNNDSDIVIGS